MIVISSTVLWGGFAHAQTASVPNTFTAGTPISATEVNANFQALVDAINALGTSGLTTASIIGTYKFKVLEVGGTAGFSNDATVSFSTSEADVTIDGNGNFTVAGLRHNDVEQHMTVISTVELKSTHVTESSLESASANFTYTLSTSGELTIFGLAEPSDIVIQMAPDFRMGVGTLSETDASSSGTGRSASLLVLIKTS